MSTPRTFLFRALLGAAVALSLSTTTITTAYAQAAAPDAKAIEEAKKHFAKAKELYDKGDKQGAVEEFKEAYKLSRNPILLYNIGFVYDDLHDKPLALHYYQKFLADAPESDKSHDNRLLASERVKVLEKEIADAEAADKAIADKEAADKAAADKAAAAKEAADQAARGVTEFTHTVLEEAPPDKPIDITAKIPPDSAWKLTLYYRTAGEDDFHTVRMKQRYEEIVGRIPGAAVRGSSVQYYIEVKDDTGKLMAASGRAASPNIVYLDADAKAHYYADLREGGSGDMVGNGDPDDIGLPDGPDGPVGPVDKGGISTLTYAKWATTGGAGAFLTTAVILYFAASAKGSELETEAYNSNHPATGLCAGGSSPPCAQYGDYDRSVQDSGQTLELWTNVTFVLGMGSAVAAAGIWYWDLKHHKKHGNRVERPSRGSDDDDAAPAVEEEARLRILATPVVGDGFIGGAAVIQF